MSRVPDHRIWPKLLLLSITQCLCSCNSLPQRDVSGKLWWELPPAVSEIVPPGWQEAVHIELCPQFIDHCDLPDPCSIPDFRQPAVAENLESLFSRHNDLLQAETRLTEQVMTVLHNIVLEWIDALIAANSDIGNQWSPQAEKAYEEIMQRVLSHEQREKYQQLSSKGNTREDAFRWLAVTDYQKQKMKEIYLMQLSRSQKAWHISRAFSALTHRSIDALLLELLTFPAKAESIASEYSAYGDIAATTHERLRAAELEIKWLAAKLESEKDPKEQIRIRKDIADKKVEANESNLASRRLIGQLAQYEWQMDRVSEVQGKLAAKLAPLLECHHTHVVCSEIIASLEGQMSYECQDEYLTLSAKLKAGIDYLAMNKQHVPLDVVRRITDIQRELEW